MPSKDASAPKAARTTLMVSPEIFMQVYDSPHSLPGKFRWVTADADVRIIEKLLGMDARTIGAPLWVSGDTQKCRKCGRETNWLDIVSSALAKTHQRELLVTVILGDKKYVKIAECHRRPSLLPMPDADSRPAQLQMPQLGVRANRPAGADRKSGARRPITGTG